MFVAVVQLTLLQEINIISIYLYLGFSKKIFCTGTETLTITILKKQRVFFLEILKKENLQYIMGSLLSTKDIDATVDAVMLQLEHPLLEKSLTAPRN